MELSKVEPITLVESEWYETAFGRYPMDQLEEVKRLCAAASSSIAHRYWLYQEFRLVADVVSELNQKLQEMDSVPDGHPFGRDDFRAGPRWPSNTKWIAVYVVRSGMHCFYVHLDVILDDPNLPRKNLAIAKCFGQELAFEVANNTTWLLGA